jgi:hypothetical protein
MMLNHYLLFMRYFDCFIITEIETQFLLSSLKFYFEKTKTSMQ